MTGTTPSLSATALAIRVFLPFALGYYLSYLYRSVNAVIAPDLVADLGMRAGDLGLLTSVYFLTFALFQPVLGILLDRYGSRRVEAALLLIAVAGATVFATAQSVYALALGRGLIGLGVSACLMAAFKAMSQWFPADRLAPVNGCILAAGGLGALSATVPVEVLLEYTSWRGVFAIAAVATLLVAVLLFAIVPERRSGTAHRESTAQLFDGVVQVFTSRTFWCIAPLTMASQATFLAIQGLWLGPWLGDVAGLQRDAVAWHLLATALAMVAGFLLMGQLSYRLNRGFGLGRQTVAVGAMVLFLVVQATLLLGPGLAPPAMLVCVVFGFLGTSGTLVFAGLTQDFGAHLAGRVNTALNMVVFVAAFVTQWLLGVIIGGWTAGGGSFALAGYRVGFGALMAAQVLALWWWWWKKDPGR